MDSNLERIKVLGEEIIDWQEKVRSSEERFRKLVEATSLLVWTARPNGEIDVNPTWLEFTGQSEEDFKDYGWLNAIHPEDREVVTEAWNKVLENPQTLEIQYRVTRIDGDSRYLKTKFVPILDKNNKLKEWVGTCEDVTEEIEDAEILKASFKQLEERVSIRTKHLSATLKFFKTLADSVPNIIWVTDADGNLEYLNKRWYEYTGIPEEEEFNTSSAVHLDEIRDNKVKWRNSVLAGKPFELEIRIRSASGEYRWFLSRSLPAKDETGKVIKWFGTSTDIHNSKEKSK